MFHLGMVREGQLRVIYSLLKPAVRAAASFRVPIRPLLDLLRLAYFEHLHRQGMSLDEIAAQFGQTPRHMRSPSWPRNRYRQWCCGPMRSTGPAPRAC